ncbi:MAG TPA: hypothetical protein GXX53_01775 [Tissierellia bacterium]|nr:hypothetical protein [Tissierellia bacterium]
MKIESGDIIVFNASDRMYKARVSKVDGNIVKLFEEDGTYRQMPLNNLKELVEKGFAKVLQKDITLKIK